VTSDEGHRGQFTQLFDDWKRGDRAARDKIIEMNLGLVGAVVGRFQSVGDEREDLFQVGSIGLIKALERFDPDLGHNFSTYAFHTILGEVRRYIRDRGALRVSRGLKERAVQVRTARAQLCQSLGREPSLKEVAQVLGADEADVCEALESSAPVMSLHDPGLGSDDESSSLLGRIGVSSPDITERVALLQTLDQLPILQKRILLLRYFNEMTQQQVAARLDISQSQVSRLERSAIISVRKMMA